MALESADSDNLEFVEDFEQPIIVPDGGEAGSPSYGAAAFRLDDDELREAYNEALAELKETDKYGELLEANYFSLEARSEERRVGKECRSRMGRCHDRSKR